MSASTKSLLIRVPISLSEAREVDPSDMFTGSYEAMIDEVKSSIDNFRPVSETKRGKTKTLVIDSVSYSDYSIEGRPVLLLQIRAYNTNIEDGFCETSTIVELGHDGKVGSETNFVLLYPLIEGLDLDKLSCSFAVLAYEDPTKDSGSVQKLARLLASRVLHRPIRSVKPESVIQEMKRLGSTIPELNITLSGVSFGDEGDCVLKSYEVKTHLRSIKNEEYKDVPVSVIDEIQDTPIDASTYQKRVVSCVFGKREYRITKVIVDDAKEAFSEMAEKICNLTTAVSEQEMADGTVHNKDFVFNKLSGVLSNFITSY